jgi:hypothetical protein
MPLPIPDGSIHPGIDEPPGGAPDRILSAVLEVISMYWSQRGTLVLAAAIGLGSITGCGADKLAPLVMPADMVGTWSSRYVQLVVRPDRTWDCSVIYQDLPACLTSQGTNSLLLEYGGTASGDLSMYSFVQDTTGAGRDHIVTSCTARYETSGASGSISGTLTIVISGGCPWSKTYDFTLTRQAAAKPNW